MAADDAATTLDAVLGGRLSLRQPRRGHRFGHDAILLAAATDARSGQHAVELGAGVGAAGLALAKRIDGLPEIVPDLPGIVFGIEGQFTEALVGVAEIARFEGLLGVLAGRGGIGGGGQQPDAQEQNRRQAGEKHRNSSHPRISLKTIWSQPD